VRFRFCSLAVSQASHVTGVSEFAERLWQWMARDSPIAVLN
jgi:hypothetical protein